MSSAVYEMQKLNLNVLIKVTSGKDEAEAKTPVSPMNHCKKEM